MELGQVRSLKEAEQDPTWQQELQQILSAGHIPDLPAPAQPQMGNQRTEHASQVCKLVSADPLILDCTLASQLKSAASHGSKSSRPPAAGMSLSRAGEHDCKPCWLHCWQGQHGKDMALTQTMAEHVQHKLIQSRMCMGCVQANLESAQQRAHHGPRLPKPAKRKAPVSHVQPPLSTAEEGSTCPVQPPRKFNRAPNAAAAALGSANTGQSVPVAELMRCPGQSPFQADAAAEELQSLPAAQLPVHTRPAVPVVTNQLPVNLLAQVGSCGAESTAVPKFEEPSSGALLSAGQTRPALPHAGASCAAKLEVRDCCMPCCGLHCGDCLVEAMLSSSSSCTVAWHYGT